MRVDVKSISDQTVTAAQQAIESFKKKNHDTARIDEQARDEKRVAPEEIIDKIKGLTEDGLYSVRFEMNSEVDEIIVKVVDQVSGDVVRQIPAEELLAVFKNLRDLRGLLVETKS